MAKACDDAQALVDAVALVEVEPALGKEGGVARAIHDAPAGDQDVETERAIFRSLPTGVGNMTEREIWLLDQTINARGVRVDVPLVEAALRITDTALGAMRSYMHLSPPDARFHAKARAALQAPGDTVKVTDAGSGETLWMGVFGRDGRCHEWSGEKPRQVQISPVLAVAA